MLQEYATNDCDYEESMDKSCKDMPLSTDELVQAHEDSLMVAMQFFESRAVGQKAGMKIFTSDNILDANNLHFPSQRNIY